MSQDLERSPGVGSIVKEFKNQIYTLSVLTAIAWTIQVSNVVLFGNRLTIWGIIPHSERGLFGIFFAPFLHISFAHLVSNTLPFLVLGWLIMVRNMEDFVLVSLLTALTSGIGVWLVSPANSVTVGASGVIFGYLGFLLARGYFERSLVAIALSISVAVMYGGILFSILPGQTGISWQAHLFGFLGGVWIASWRNTKKD